MTPMKIDDVWVRALILLLALGGLVIAGALVNNNLAASEVPELAYTFRESPAFRMSYPDSWMYQMGQGRLLFGEKDGIFRGNPGPSIFVFRTDTLFEPTLREKFDTYLRRGPLRGDRFQLVSEITETTFDGRPALEAHVEGRQVGGEESPLYHSYIVITQADNGVVYVIGADVPASMWDENWPLIQAMLATVDIRE